MSSALGFSFSAMAWAHSSARPYLLTIVGLAPAVVANWVVPSSPSSHGLHTSTDHSSPAFWSTTSLPLLNPKCCAAGGADVCTGRQAPSPGLGSREKATVRVWVMPSETP